MKKLLCILLVVVLTLTTAAGCTQPTEKDPNAKIKLVVAYGSTLTGSVTVATAQAEGFFEEEGLEVELLGFPAMPAAIAAMAGGDVDFTCIGQGAHALVMNGQAEIFSMESMGDGEKVIARKSSGINSMADLKRKTVAVQFGTSAETILNMAMEKAGLTRKDVTVTSMDPAGCATAIIAGHVDAVCTFGSASSTILEQLGDNAIIISRTSEFADKFVSLSSWCTLPKTIAERPEVVQKFTNAIMKAVDFRSENIEQAILYSSKILKQDLALVLKEKDDAKWINMKAQVDAINSKEMNGWYDSVMKEFFKTGKITKEVAFDEYFDTSFVLKAYETLNK